MRRLAILLTPMVIGFLPTAVFAQDCQNFQQTMGCDQASIDILPDQQAVRKSICNKARQKIVDSCAGSDGNSCTGVFQHDPNASSFNTFNSNLRNLSDADARSGSAIPELYTWNAQKTNCTAPAMPTPSSANCTAGPHGNQSCMSNAFKQQEQALEESAATCRMQAMICKCEVERAKHEVDTNTPNITDPDARRILKQRIDQGAGCGDFSWAGEDTTASNDQAHADSLDQQANNTQAAPGGPQAKSGDPDKSDATNDGDTDKNKDTKKKGSSSSNPLQQLAQALQNMPQPQPQTPPTQPQTPDMSASNCSGANMVGPGCGAGVATASPQTFPRPAVTGGFQTADASAKGFNPGDTSTTPGPQGIPPVNSNNQNQLQPLGATVVANNTGGNIPQSNGGGGGAPASSGGGIMASLAKPFREIMGGLTSYGSGSGGSYGTTNEHLSLAAGGVNVGYGGYTKGGDEEQLKLADFLPNGARAPAAVKNAFGIGGYGSGKTEQIQSSRVNIWNRISDHFKSRCAQGLLRDCFP